MRKNNQKSLISVHFVCVKAAGSLLSLVFLIQVIVY